MKMTMKFRDVLKFYGIHDLEFDAVIGDVDMPATYCFSGELKFTDYCEQKYGKLLDATAEVESFENYTDTVIVDYPDENLGESFTWAVAGYVNESEYNKLFDED